MKPVARSRVCPGKSAPKGAIALDFTRLHEHTARGLGRRVRKQPKAPNAQPGFGAKETSMKYRDGFLVLGHLWGAPIRVHWSTPIVAFVLTGLSFVPGAWLGFLVVVLVHEIGHAIAVRSSGAHVISVNVQGFGGTCEWYGNVTAKQRAIIAWGGVLAQAGLYIAARFASVVLPSWGTLGELVYTLTATNLILIVINLLPIRPLDGAEAWRLFRR